MKFQSLSTHPHADGKSKLKIRSPQNISRASLQHAQNNWCRWGLTKRYLAPYSMTVSIKVTGIDPKLIWGDIIFTVHPVWGGRTSSSLLLSGYVTSFQINVRSLGFQRLGLCQTSCMEPLEIHHQLFLYILIHVPMYFSFGEYCSTVNVSWTMSLQPTFHWLKGEKIIT